MLPICFKVFVKLVFDPIFEFIIESNLLSSTQSDFKPNDSCVNQLTTMTLVFLVRGIFLDLLKAFDKVSHEGLQYKRKNSGINGILLDLIGSFLHNRRQTVVLSGQSSNGKLLKGGVPQGSVLGSLFFLIYINDILQRLIFDAKVFADDTSLFSTATCPKVSASASNSDLLKIKDWEYQRKMSFRCPD